MQADTLTSGEFLPKSLIDKICAPFRVSEPAAGVITAADACFFPGLQLLCCSLQDKVSVAIVDLGLSPAQREWCTRRGAIIVSPRLEIGRSIKGWQSWNKPFYLASSPFTTALWLDADCFVVGDLNALFRRIREAPLLIRHWDAGQYKSPNRQELYDRFPVKRRLGDRAINAGVLGFDISRDAALLGAYCNMVRLAESDAQLREYITWYDEGALHWAVEKLDMIDEVVDCAEWNRPASSTSRDPLDFIARLQPASRDVVLHFSSNPKPWNSWPLPLSSLIGKSCCGRVSCELQLGRDRWGRVCVLAVRASSLDERLSLRYSGMITSLVQYRPLASIEEMHDSLPVDLEIDGSGSVRSMILEACRDAVSQV